MDENRDERSLEEMLAQVEGYVQEMQQRDISLEEAFSIYQQGVKLLKECDGRIDIVEKQLLILNQQEQPE